MNYLESTEIEKLKQEYLDTIGQLKQSFVQEIESLHEMLGQSMNNNVQQKEKINMLQTQVDKMTKASQVVAQTNEQLQNSGYKISFVPILNDSMPALTNFKMRILVLEDNLDK